MAITTFFCSWDDVVGRLSADGAAARIDDDPNRQTDILRRATVECLKYLGLHYTSANLATSDIMREVCADVAWFMACGRRNNPAPKAAAEAYKQAIDYMTNVMKGAFQIPDIPAQKASAPALSNQRAATYPVNRVVTVPGTSTGTPKGYSQQTDQSDEIDYTV